jgi:hypothetical protein
MAWKATFTFCPALQLLRSCQCQALIATVVVVAVVVVGQAILAYQLTSKDQGVF